MFCGGMRAPTSEQRYVHSHEDARVVAAGTALVWLIAPDGHTVIIRAFEEN